MQKQNSQQYIVVDTFPQYVSRNENPNNFRVEILNETLKTPAYILSVHVNDMMYTTNLEICSAVPEEHLEKPETVVW